MKWLSNALKGILIGIATLVPGVSGGTMAIILGMYDELIHSVSSFLDNVRGNTIYLLSVGVGGIIGIASFSKIINYLLDNFRFPMMYLFLGIIGGGLSILYKKAVIDKHHHSDFIYLTIGLIIILIMSMHSGTIVNLASSTGILNFLFLIVAGVVIAVALILPGISTSFMLLALGLYDITLEAINDVQVSFLVPIMIGIFLGTIITTKVIESLLNNKPRQTYLVIIGFVIGSIVQIYPGIPSGIDIIISLITFFIGYVFIKHISQKYSD